MTHNSFAPSPVWVLPFAILLLAIAVLPLIPRLAHWWEHNRNKLLVSGVLALITCAYYLLRGHGLDGHGEPVPAGLPTLLTILKHSVLGDYIPFMVLLFSLYTISGGIRLSGDIPAHPSTNLLFLFIGSFIASFIGTTGASMLLIRPLLQINSERRHVRHTVIFFIFIVSNIGGLLLPLGDPPLFLGYLRGVPFLWTLSLWPQWLFCNAVLLALFYGVDHYFYRKEAIRDLILDETTRLPLRLEGAMNFALLLGVVLAVALLVPGKRYGGFAVPDLYLREIALLAFSGLSMLITSRKIRMENHFNFGAIAEVSALFIGIFITMQAPIEILQSLGPRLGLHSPVHFFWASGILSSFLDNAPTYVVFFEAARALGLQGVPMLPVEGSMIAIHLLTAISCGSVLMGANTYIGNGPNFLVKSIAESRGIKMPSFFGYIGYSIAILIPLFILVTLIFFR